MAGRLPGGGDDALAVLLLPASVERFERGEHARSLLSIPRVIALEPARIRPPAFLRDHAPLRQARRLRFPGRLRLLVLYHPAQYPLARALRDRHEAAELWYLPPAEPFTGDEAERWTADDALARHHARTILEPSADGSPDPAPLRERLVELDVISPYAFDPRARRAPGR